MLTKQHLIDPEICIRCNTCQEMCPIGAIEHDANNYVVKFEVCNWCNDCISPCPTGSIDNYRRVPKGRTYTMEANFTLGPGTQISLKDHPRGDCNGKFLVVRTRIIEDDGASPTGDPVTNHHLLECVPVSIPL